MFDSSAGWVRIRRSEFESDVELDHRNDRNLLIKNKTCILSAENPRNKNIHFFYQNLHTWCRLVWSDFKQIKVLVSQFSYKEAEN